jgi:hypothetical protein
MTEPVAAIAGLPLVDQAVAPAAGAAPGSGWMAVLMGAQDLAGAPAGPAAAPAGDGIPSALGRPDGAVAAAVANMPTQVPGAGPPATLASPAAAAGAPGGAGPAQQPDAALPVPPAGLSAAMPATAAPAGQVDGKAMDGWGEPSRFAALPLNVAAALSQSGYAARDLGQAVGPDRASSLVQPAPGSGTPPNLGNAGAQLLPAGAGPPAQAAAAIVGQAAQGAGAPAALSQPSDALYDAGQPAPASGHASPLGQAAGQPSLASAGQPAPDSATKGGQAVRGPAASAAPSQFGEAADRAGQPPGLDRPASLGQPAPPSPGMAARGPPGQAGTQALPAGPNPPVQAGIPEGGRAAQDAGSSVPLMRSGHSPPDAGQPPGSGRLASPGQPASAAPGGAQQPSLGQAGVQTILAGPGAAQPGLAQPSTVEPGQAAQDSRSAVVLSQSGSAAHDPSQPAPGPGVASPSLGHADAQVHLAGLGQPARDSTADGSQSVRDAAVFTAPPPDMLGAAVAAWGAVGEEQPTVRARKHRHNPALGGDAGDAQLASYQETRQVGFDLSPASVEAACWRMDDTSVQVLGGPGGEVRAAQLYGALMAGGRLDLLRPGERIRTWEGSPFWLHLAGIAKPQALGVLPSSAAPARIEVARHEAGWTATHAGGGWPALRRTALPRGAEDTDTLLHTVLWGAGLEEPAHLFAAVARRRLDAARFQCASGSSEPAALRRAEAWAVAARGWALALARADGAPPALPPLPDDPAGQTAALCALAQRHGSAYAV